LDPSFDEEDATRAQWHGDVALEIIPIWHASLDLCTLLGCFGDAFYINMGNGSSHDTYFELKGNHGALDINGDAHVLTCL
jgi:hypothetical protein